MIIWNPWHGCHKVSEGCQHCYMYFLDRMRGIDTSRVTRNAGFDMPLRRGRDGKFKIAPGMELLVGLSTDFFVEEADAWRDEAWEVIRRRPDVVFRILTKRAGRILGHLPADWGDGYENVMLQVTTENQARADERLSILLDVPARHKGFMAAPLLGPVDAEWAAADYAQQTDASFLVYGEPPDKTFGVAPIPEQVVSSFAELHAGVEPTVVVSNLYEGVELVLGTHYTLAYLNNTACGIATVVVTGINGYEGNVKEAAFAIHSVRRVTASYNLTADEDWTDYESVEVFSNGVTIDLKGHKMTVTGLSGAGHITDSVGGGELIFDVPAAYASGYAAKIDTVDLRGQLKLVKTGPGLLICSKSGQSYTGGTDILGGILRTADSTSGKTMDVFSPLGSNTSSAHNQVYLGPNGILDPASTAGWAYHDLTIDGGMISNTVANTQLPGIARCFNPCFTVNADFTFATTEQYGLQLREYGGHTVTVSIAPNKVLYLMTGAPLPTSGRINIVSGGKIGTLSSYPPDFSTVDFVDCNAALTLIGAMSVHDYKPCNTETAGGGSAALSVYGTFTPDSDYFYGPVMQNGSAIDLSAKTGAWSVTSSLTSGNKTTTFASGATIKLELGERSFAKGERVISWTTQPDATFTNKEWKFESRSDGLYVDDRVGTGTVIVVF